MKKDRREESNSQEICAWFLINIFLLVWASIGLYIWRNQMNSNCKKTSIGNMILAWCIIKCGTNGIGIIALCYLVVARQSKK